MIEPRRRGGDALATAEPLAAVSIGTENVPVIGMENVPVIGMENVPVLRLPRGGSGATGAGQRQKMPGARASASRFRVGLPRPRRKCRSGFGASPARVFVKQKHIWLLRKPQKLTPPWRARANTG